MAAFLVASLPLAGLAAGWTYEELLEVYGNGRPSPASLTAGREVSEIYGEDRLWAALSSEEDPLKRAEIGL